MINKLNSSSNIIMKLFLMVLWVVVFIGPTTARLCWSKSQEPAVADCNLFPLLGVKDEPIREVLKQLGQAEGYSIEMSTNWENIRITIPSSIVKFEEDLKRMLSFAGIKNYALGAYDE